jgi:hypothetical protein
MHFPHEKMCSLLKEKNKQTKETNIPFACLFICTHDHFDELSVYVIGEKFEKCVLD